MRVFRPFVVLTLVTFLLAVLFIFMEQSSQAREPGPPSPGSAYLNLRPQGSAFHTQIELSTQDTSIETADSSIQTNFLENGDSYIHGFIYYNDYLWATTRTKPARILKINPTSLEVEVNGRIELGSNFDNGEDIVSANGYIWVILFSDSNLIPPDPTRLIRVDPDTMTADVAINFLTSDLLFGASLEYAFGYLWAGGQENIARIDIVEPLTPSYQIYDYSSLVIDDSSLFNSLTSSPNYMWGSMYQFFDPPREFLSSTVVRIDPDIPTDVLTETLSVLFPDDITYVGNHLYISSEDSGNPSDIYKFATDPNNYTVTNVANSASYGTFLNPMDPGTFWGVYRGSPGIIKKFDLSPNPMVTITLPSNFNDPNELAFDDRGSMYVTTWTSPTGVVKYPAPISVTDLSINQSGSDAILNWSHLGGDVTTYQVWRSTVQFFTPGDELSVKIGDVTPTNGIVTFTDTDSGGDISPAYFYVVNAVNMYGLVSQPSNEVSLKGTTTSITSHNPDPSKIGQAVTVLYNVASSGGTPTGDVTVSDGTDSCFGKVVDEGCSITFLSSGIKTLVATYHGDGNFMSSISPEVTHVVIADDPSKTNTESTITAHTPNPSVLGQEVVVSYMVTSESGTPTGEVVVSDGTNSCIGTVATGSCFLNFTSVGEKSITAIYVGDDKFNSSISPEVSHKITANTITSIISHKPNPSTIGELVTITYNVSSIGGSPTGNVIVSDGTEICTGTVSESSCTIIFTTNGQKKLVANYSGDDYFNSSFSSEELHNVTERFLFLPIINNSYLR